VGVALPARTKLSPIELVGHDKKRGGIDLDPIIAAFID